MPPAPRVEVERAAAVERRRPLDRRVPEHDPPDAGLAVRRPARRPPETDRRSRRTRRGSRGARRAGPSVERLVRAPARRARARRPATGRTARTTTGSAGGRARARRPAPRSTRRRARSTRPRAIPTDANVAGAAERASARGTARARPPARRAPAPRDCPRAARRCRPAAAACAAQPGQPPHEPQRVRPAVDDVAGDDEGGPAAARSRSPSTASPASASSRSTAPSCPWRSVAAQTVKSSGIVIGGTCGAAIGPEASTVAGGHRLSILPCNGGVHGSRRLSAARPARRPVTRVARHLGLDLGGTNTKWAVVEHDADDWRTLATGQGPTPASEGPDAVVGRLASMGAEVVAPGARHRERRDRRPGPLRPRHRARPASSSTSPARGPASPSRVRSAPRSASRRRSSTTPARSASRSCGSGAGRGASTMIGLTLGTGVGGVIAIDGRVHQGHDGTAGEIGHQTIDPDGPWCGCGNRGCVEAYARADQLAKACASPTAEEAVARARNGDAPALDGLAPGRPLPRHRDREPRHARHARPGRHRRRRGGGGRPPVRADPRRAPACGCRTTSLDERDDRGRRARDVGGRDRGGGARRGAGRRGGTERLRDA